MTKAAQKSAFAIVILYEAFRWLVHEIRHRHFGGFGLFFEQFLVNEVAAGTYSGFRLKAVLLFVLSACRNGARPECLDFVFQKYGSALPFDALAYQVLVRLKRLAPEDRYPTVAARLSSLTSPPKP